MVYLMALASNIFRRGATYSARIRVPLDLVDLVGKTELVKALGTSDPSEAKRLVHPVVSAWLREFDDLRARRDLIPADREHAVWDHYTEVLARDDVARSNLPREAEIDLERAALMAKVERGEVASRDPLVILDATLELQAMQQASKISSEHRAIKLADMRKHLANGNTALISHEVDEYLEKNRLLVQRGTPDWVSLARHMMRAEIDALERTLERDKGDFGGGPTDPLVKPANGPRRETAKAGEAIMEIFEIFAGENPNGVAVDRLNQCRRDIGTFVDLVGARFPVGKIGKVEVREWKQLLMKYPVKATETKVFAGMNIRQVVQANETLGKPVIAKRTVNRYLSSLGAFLTWAVDNGYVETNATSGLMLKKEGKTPTVPFDPEQLEILFKSPWFNGCKGADEWRNVAKAGEVKMRDHRFWVPLIMLFSGARPAEIGQLAVGDVRQVHDQWIMHITTEGDETDEGKSVKTAGSMRVVPVHPELIRLGFLRYHEQRAREGGNSLFPNALRNARGQMMADVSREFGRYLTKIGIKEGRGLSLYSFRHGATDALRRAGYLDNQFGFILGHAEPSMTGRYGVMPQGMLQQRVELVNAISYPDLILDHLTT